MATTAGQMYSCGCHLGFLINTKNIHFAKDHQRKVPVKCFVAVFGFLSGSESVQVF
jgi:hypothetical protein